MLKEITQFIENKTTSFTIGTNLFAGFRPDSPDRCVGILEMGGSAVYFDLPDRSDKMIQALSRAADYWDSRADSFEIYDILHGSTGWTLPVVGTDEYYAMVIEAVSDPQYLGTDQNGRHQFSTNYIFKIRDV